MALTGEEILKERIVNALKKQNPNAVISIDDILKWIPVVLDAIRQCRNPEAVRRHIKRGSLLARFRLSNGFERAGYQGDSWELASIVVADGKNAPEEEISALIDDVADVPQPPAVVVPGGWPIAIIVAVLTFAMFTSTAQADWPIPDKNVFSEIDSWPMPAPTPTPAPKPKLDPIEQDHHDIELGYKIPVSNPWVYSGDNGTRQAMINHLLQGAEHRNRLGTTMAWMGVRNLDEYKAELSKLSLTELRQLHSADHNKLTVPKRKVSSTAPTVTKTVSTRSSTTTAAQPSAGTKPAVKYKRVRVGLFRWKTVPVNSSGVIPMRSGCPAGGCPGY